MHARHGQPSQQILVEQGSAGPRLHLVDPGSHRGGREGTLPQHPWEQWQGAAGVEWHVGFMPVWAYVCPQSNRAVFLLVGLARKHSELDRDVLVGICEWGERRTMQRLEAKCLQ